MWLVPTVLLTGLLTWLGWAYCTLQWPFQGPGMFPPLGERGPDLHERALPQLRAAAVGNPRLGSLLDEIDRRRPPATAGDDRDIRVTRLDIERGWAARAELLTHCRPATAADLAGPIDAWHASGGATKPSRSEWWVLTSHPGHVPSLYGAHAVQVLVPPGVGLHPGTVPDTFHGAAGHSTFLFEGLNVAVSSSARLSPPLLHVPEERA